MDPPEGVPVPVGWRLAPDPGLRWLDDTTLVGGAPLRVVRLGGRGAELVRAWSAGEAVGDEGPARRLARRLCDAGILHPVVGVAPAGDRVTLAVPVRDDREGLERVLAAAVAAGAGRPGGARLLVVDDGSRRDHATVARRHGAAFVRHERPRGPGAARNTALARVRTPLVAFCDADVEARGAWWDRLAGHLADPAVALVAPRIRSRPGRGRLAAYERRHCPLDLGPVPSAVGPGRRVPYIPAAALCARTDTLVRLGGFDEALHHGEDVDLVWRLAAGGHTVRYEPAVGVLHRPRPTWRAWLAQRRAYGSSAAPLARRHGRAVAPARCSPWSAAAWAATVAGHPLVGAVTAVGSTAALAVRLRRLPRQAALAVRLAGWGHVHAGRGLAAATRRAWWPALVPLARWRGARRWLVAALAVAPVVERWFDPDPGPPLDTVIGVVDDLAYSLGVWEGVVRARDPGALIPDLT